MHKAETGRELELEEWQTVVPLGPCTPEITQWTAEKMLDGVSVILDFSWPSPFLKANEGKMRNVQGKKYFDRCHTNRRGRVTWPPVSAREGGGSQAGATRGRTGHTCLCLCHFFVNPGAEEAAVMATGPRERGLCKPGCSWRDRAWVPTRPGSARLRSRETCACARARRWFSKGRSPSSRASFSFPSCCWTGFPNCFLTSLWSPLGTTGAGKTQLQFPDSAVVLADRLSCHGRGNSSSTWKHVGH